MHPTECSSLDLLYIPPTSHNKYVLPFVHTNLLQGSYFHHAISLWNSLPSSVTTTTSTVAEKDTAAAAKAAVGRPKAAVGRQRAAHRLRLAAAAQPRPLICLKVDSLAYNWLIRLLSRTHAQAVSLSVCLCHRPHDMHRHLGTVGYNGDQIQQRNGLCLVWIRSILGYRG